MFDEPFAHGRSLVHAVDPRFRLVAAFVCAVCLAVVRTPEAAWFGFGMAALLLALSRPPVRPVLRRLVVVNVFIAFLWLTVPLTSGGEAIAEWGPLEVSRAGVLLTLLVTVKSNAIVMTFLALVATMDSPTIGYALERLRFPSKLVFLFLFTYRYLHVIADEWHKLHVAARLRGFAPKTNMHTYRTFGNMLGMVFVHSFDRSVRVYEAMILRGFSGRFQSVTAFRATSRDAVFAWRRSRAWFASWPLICIWSFPVAEPIFALEHISFTYAGGRQVFRDMDFALYPDRKIGLYGPNGSGKTTFFRLIMGLAAPQEGRILFHGRPLETEKDFRELRCKVGLVLQHAEDQLFCPTVLEDVAFGPLNLGCSQDEARVRAASTLERLGLAGFENRLTHRLSGGEKKLVSLATVLVMEPEALLLDEPTNGLDPEARQRIIGVLKTLPTARIIISHDWDFLAETSSEYLTVEGQHFTDAAPSHAHAHMHVHPLGNKPHEH